MAAAINSKGETGVSLEQALQSLVKQKKTTFDETVELALILGVDPKQSDQQIRFAASLPHGLGKQVRVAVFADGDLAKAAKDAGADEVGMDDLATSMKKGNLDYNVVIAAKMAIPKIAALGKILGPKGLMPNPKLGTVTDDVAAAVKRAKSGQVMLRTEKAGIIHCGVGKCSFNMAHLVDNINHVIQEVKKSKPAAAKGVFLKRIYVSTTMGQAVLVDAQAFR